MYGQQRPQPDGGSVHPAVVFGDIHANLPALEAVFAAMEARGLDETLYCLGDLVGYGTFPNEVIEQIRQREIPTIMGNYPPALYPSLGQPVMRNRRTVG